MTNPRPGAVRIGTSGWHYRHWVGPVYPRGTRPGEFLRLYAQRFATAEINRTFYSLPDTAVLAGWRDTTPSGFVFAVKASRYLTHMKKLREPAEALARLFAATDGLGAKLGPVLFQLPPRWRADPARLDDFCAALPAGRRYAFECRDESWWDDLVYETLARHGAAWCVYDLAGRRAPPIVTADFVYVWLHGPHDAYRGGYSAQSLTAWARRVAAWRDAGRDVYCYFDNDEAGHAVADAARLIRLVEARGAAAGTSGTDLSRRGPTVTARTVRGRRGGLTGATTENAKCA